MKKIKQLIIEAPESVWLFLIGGIALCGWLLFGG